MKAIFTTLVCLFTMAMAQAQNKEQQLQSIKEAYDLAQERVANDGKEGHQRKCLDLVLRDEGGYAGRKIKDVAHIYYYEDHTSAEDGALQVNNKPYFVLHERVYEGYSLYEEYPFKMNDTGEMCDDPLIYAFRRERRDENNYESEKQYVTLDVAVTFLKKYINLLKLRYTDQVNVKLDVPELGHENIALAPLVFIPFVENAFKHGVAYDKPSTIDISIKHDGGRLLFHCCNTKSNVKHEYGGVGLNNVTKRLELIYGTDYSLDIKDEAETYSVLLDLPERRPEDFNNHKVVTKE